MVPLLILLRVCVQWLSSSDSVSEWVNKRNQDNESETLY